jgi:hypothetical protein
MKKLKLNLLCVLYLLILFVEIKAHSIVKYFPKLSEESNAVQFKINRTSKRIDISKRSLVLPKIKYFNLFSNKLENGLINGSSLKILPIEEFVLRSNQIRTLRTEFIYFKELSFLDISDNFLNQFIVTSNPGEKVSTKLSTIWLQNNQIIRIENLPSFTNLSFDNIQYVDLASNQIKSSISKQIISVEKTIICHFLERH